MIKDIGGKIVLLSDRLLPLATFVYKTKLQRRDILGRLIEVCKEPWMRGCSVKVSPRYVGLQGYDKVRGEVRGYTKWAGNPMVQEIFYASKYGRRRAIANLQQTWPGLKFVHIVPELQNV